MSKNWQIRPKQKSVSEYIRRLVISFTLITSLLVAAVISFHEIYVFYKIRSDQREAYLEEQKTFIKDLTRNEVEYIHSLKNQFEDRIKGQFRKNVIDAYNLSENIYRKYQGKMSNKELRRLIINSVASVQDSSQYSGVFINTLDGNGIFYKGKPSYSGKDLSKFKDVNGNFVVRNEIELLSDKNEGFIVYEDNASWEMDSVPSHKIVFVKKFGHFNWYFGYKGYFEDYYQEFKMEIAQKVSSVRFRHGGYVFLNEAVGNPVVFNGEIFSGDFNYFDGTDTVKQAVFELQVDAAKSSVEGGYFSYLWEKIDGKEPVPKISYVKKFEPCNWYVGAGFYVDEIEATLNAQLDELKKGLIGNLIQIFVLLVLILAVEFWLIYKFNSKYKDDFSHFTNFFKVGKGKYETIEVEKLHFDEFRQMGVIANEMISEREKTYKQLVREQRKATESDRLKTAFLANMSHEIRTPMNAILGFTELLDDPELDEGSKKEYSSIVLRNGEYLLGLINDIIDISKIESDQLNISKKKFRLDKLVEEVGKHYREIMISKNGSVKLDLKINLPVNYLCYSDEFRLKQVLDNLMGNAVKFTQRGYVRLDVSKNSSKVWFKVVDSGIGIPTKEQRKIFERFAQAKASSNENFGGTGLGLAISKNIINLLGGDIEVSSRPGKGSEFIFHIPA